jgi:hypothetical protein
MDPRSRPNGELSFYLSWKRGSFDYNQECMEHAFTGVNSKSAWRAIRCTEHAFTGVNQKSAWRAARLQSIMHRSAQQNKTQECNGAHCVNMPITGVTAAIDGDPSCRNISCITGVCWSYL